MARPSGRIAAFFIISFILAMGCGKIWGKKSVSDEKLTQAYTELAINGDGDSTKAQRVLDSLHMSRQEFIAGVTEKADDMKEWQEFHEAAIKRMEVAALRGDRKRTDLPTPIIQ